MFIEDRPDGPEVGLGPPAREPVTGRVQVVAEDGGNSAGHPEEVSLPIGELVGEACGKLTVREAAGQGFERLGNPLPAWVGAAGWRAPRQEDGLELADQERDSTGRGVDLELDLFARKLDPEDPLEPPADLAVGHAVGAERFHRIGRAVFPLDRGSQQVDAPEENGRGAG